jgi:hypothetical protein
LNLISATPITNGNGHAHHSPVTATTTSTNTTTTSTITVTTVKTTLANQSERRLDDGRRCIKPLCIDIHNPAPPPASVFKTPVAPVSPVSTSNRRMPSIPIDPKVGKGTMRSSTSSLTLPSSISSTALFPPLKLQSNLIRKVNNEYELRTEKSDHVYLLSCVHEQTKLIQWKNVFQSPVLTVQATKTFIALVTLHDTHHCAELFVLERLSGLRLYSNLILTQTVAGLYISESLNSMQRATISLIYITGLLTVFDVTRHSMTCPLIDVNIAHLLPPHASIIDVFTLNQIRSDTVCLLTSESNNLRDIY